MAFCLLSLKITLVRVSWLKIIIVIIIIIILQAQGEAPPLLLRKDDVININIFVFFPYFEGDPAPI